MANYSPLASFVYFGNGQTRPNQFDNASPK